MAEAADASRDGSRHDADDELSAYRHDSASADQAARLVDSAYVVASRSWDVSSELRAQAVAAGSDPDAPPARELIFAVSYRLRLEPGGKPGCDLVSSPDTDDYAWPPRISEAPPDFDRIPRAADRRLRRRHKRPGSRELPQL